MTGEGSAGQELAQAQPAGWRNALLALLAGLGVFYLLIGAFQTKLIFPATRELYRDPSVFGWEFEDVFIEHNGESTHAWFVPAESPRGVALFSHGNAGNIADRLESIGLLRTLGLSVLAYDYGGYGQSDGRPSEARCYRDIRAAWRYLTEERGVPPEEIVLFGRSLGGAITIDLAREVMPAAVIVESTFLSISDVARGMLPFLPVNWIIRHRMDSKSKIAGVRSPLLVIHSPDDTLIPYAHGRALYEKAQAPKTFLEIRGDHNTGFVESMEVYRAGWEEFLAPILPRPEPAGGGNAYSK